MDRGRLLLLYSERSQIVTAGNAEFMLGAVRGLAVGTDYFQLGPTSYAEIHSSWVLELAFPAFHVAAPGRSSREVDWCNP